MQVCFANCVVNKVKIQKSPQKKQQHTFSSTLMMCDLRLSSLKKTNIQSSVTRPHVAKNLKTNKDIFDQTGDSVFFKF